MDSARKTTRQSDCDSSDSTIVDIEMADELHSPTPPTDNPAAPLVAGDSSTPAPGPFRIAWLQRRLASSIALRVSIKILLMLIPFTVFISCLISLAISGMDPFGLVLIGFVQGVMSIIFFSILVSF